MRFRSTLRFREIAVFAAWTLVAVSNSGHAQEPVVPEEEWSVRSYHLPTGVIDSWVDSFNGGPLSVVGMPLEDAPSKEIADYIRACTELLAPGVNEAVGPLPVGTLMTALAERSEISIRTCESVHLKLTEFAASRPPTSTTAHTVATTLNVVETDDLLASDLAAEAMTLSDHKVLLTQLEAAVNEGKARWVTTERLTASKGYSAGGSSGGVSGVPESLRKQRNNSLVFAMVDDDPELSWSSGASWDQEDIGWLVDVDLAMRSPEASHRQIKVGISGGDEVVIPVEDNDLVHLRSSLKMPAGGTQLLGVWRTEGSQRRRLAFVSLQISFDLSAESNRMAGWLRDHGENVEPTPQSIDYQENIRPLTRIEIPEGMELRKFRVHPGSSIFFHGRLPLGEDGVGSSQDPFAKTDEPDPFGTRLISANTSAPMEAIQGAGIEFQGEVRSVFNPTTLQFTIIQPPEVLAQIEKLIKLDWQRGPLNVVGTLRVIESDAGALRAWMNNERGALDFEPANVALANAGFRVLNEACVRTSVRGWGQASRGLDYHLWNGNAGSERDGPSSSTKSQPDSILLGSVERRVVGLEWSFMPLKVRRNGPLELDASVKFDTAPPEARDRNGLPGVRFFEESMKAHVTVPDGSNRLIGVWTPAIPEGDEGQDVLHAAFLEVHVTKAGW